MDYRISDDSFKIEKQIRFGGWQHEAFVKNISLSLEGSLIFASWIKKELQNDIISETEMPFEPIMIQITGDGIDETHVLESENDTLDISGYEVPIIITSVNENVENTRIEIPSQ